MLSFEEIYKKYEDLCKKGIVNYYDRETKIKDNLFCFSNYEKGRYDVLKEILEID
jgi:hypothetical protein